MTCSHCNHKINPNDLHFHCNNCGKIACEFCIEDASIIESDIFVCPDCSAQIPKENIHNKKLLKA